MRAVLNSDERRLMPWTSYPLASRNAARYAPSCPVTPVISAFFKLPSPRMFRTTVVAVAAQLASASDRISEKRRAISLAHDYQLCYLTPLPKRKRGSLAEQTSYVYWVEGRRARLGARGFSGRLRTAPEPAAYPDAG